MEVSTGDLAEILAVSERRVQQLAKQGILRRQAHGEWVLAESVQAYIAFRVRGETRRIESVAGSPDAKLKAVKARREELRLAREERELVPLADAIFAMDRVAGTIALEVNNLQARITRDLDERDRIRNETDAVLRKVAESVAECGAALRADSGDPSSEDEDDA